jgi:MarR-like DNA-binding transcriptional regulator SgrR of sgrS sRNA
MDSNNIIEKFKQGIINPNEFAVYVALCTQADKGKVQTSAPEIAERLGGTLSRHAVARSLRSLQKKKFINWQAGQGRIASTISLR